MQRLVLLFGLCFGVSAFGAQTPNLISSAITERGPNHQVITRVEERMTARGQLRRATNSYVELASGLNRLVNGQYVASEEKIEILPNDAGVRAHGAQHELVVPQNITSAEGAKLRAADGKLFHTRIYGLALFDPATQASLLIAEPQDSQAEVQPDKPATVIYKNAFTDIHADLRIQYTKAGVEQDVIVRQKIVPENFGFNSATAQLLMLTEFINPPNANASTAPAGTTNEIRTLIGANLYDQRFNFGSMAIDQGRAFLIDGQEGPGLPALHSRSNLRVGKSWMNSEGRQFLVETVNYQAIANDVQALPAGEPVAAIRRAKRAKLSEMIAGRSRSSKSKPVYVARAESKKGFVIDYAILNSSASNLILDSTSTYYISGPLVVSGFLTVEQGTVVKFAPNAMIKVQGGFRCTATEYMPALFLAKDDDSAGATITGSSGTPSGYYANPALFFDNNISEMRNVRISDAQEAIFYDSDSYGPHLLTHAQIIHCQRGITAQKNFIARNVLFSDVQTVFGNSVSGVSGQCEHLTIHQANVFNGSTAGSHAEVDEQLARRREHSRLL
jgi:hypothetical protein